jgi:hypothetical protein
VSDAKLNRTVPGFLDGFTPEDLREILNELREVVRGRKDWEILHIADKSQCIDLDVRVGDLRCHIHALKVSLGEVA